MTGYDNGNGERTFEPPRGTDGGLAGSGNDNPTMPDPAVVGGTVKEKHPTRLDPKKVLIVGGIVAVLIIFALAQGLTPPERKSGSGDGGDPVAIDIRNKERQQAGGRDIGGRLNYLDETAPDPEPESQPEVAAADPEPAQVPTPTPAPEPRDDRAAKEAALAEAQRQKAELERQAAEMRAQLEERKRLLALQEAQLQEDREAREARLSSGLTFDSVPPRPKPEEGIGGFGSGTAGQLASAAAGGFGNPLDAAGQVADALGAGRGNSGEFADSGTVGGQAIGSPLNPYLGGGQVGMEPVLNPNEVQPGFVRQNLQTEKIAFLGGGGDRLNALPGGGRRGINVGGGVGTGAGLPNTYLATAPVGPVTPQYELSAGTFIPGFTVTGINTDLPGKVVGKISADVFDSATGRFVLVPQGTMAIGEYQSLVSNGQNRVLIRWEMLTFPDGRSIDLQGQPGTDVAGYAGLADQVDYHYKELFDAAGLSALVSVGAEAAEGDSPGLLTDRSFEEDIGEILSGAGQDTSARIAEQIIQRQLDRQPTIVVRPGWSYRILLTRNLLLEPYIDNRGR